MKELTTLYELRHDVAPRDRSIFYSSAAQHIKERPELNAIKDWILTHRMALVASAEQARQHGIHRNRTITDFIISRNNKPDGEPQAWAGRLP